MWRDGGQNGEFIYIDHFAREILCLVRGKKGITVGKSPKMRWLSCYQLKKSYRPLRGTLDRDKWRRKSKTVMGARLVHDFQGSYVVRQRTRESATVKQIWTEGQTCRTDNRVGR